MLELESHIEEGERTLARIWKGIALRGLLAIAFAMVVLVWPNIGLGTLIALVGLFALTSGAATIIAAFRTALPAGHRWWMVLEGLLSTAVGVVVFIWPGLSALALLYAMAAWAIAVGIIQLTLAFALPFSGGRSVLLMLGALLSGTFGLVMFARPGAGAIALLALIAAFALVTGATQIVWALELRRVAATVKGRVRPRTATAPLAGH
jgi:uncharacterized membrane protein HdeD (DUF308 family)